jgi:hypothetical protein
VAVPADEFAERYWARQPLLTSAERLARHFRDLFSAAAVDELVSRRGLRAPFLRVAKNGSTLDDSAFTSGGGVGAAIADQASDDKLLRLFAGGATIVLQGLHRTWPPLLDFAQQLAADLGHPVQVNAYVTPPQNTGFSDHYDVHDVFVLQVEGEKRWRVRPPVHPLPLRDQPWDQRRLEVERAATRPPLLEVTLQPGDCLYLPRGFLHSATALGGVSTHVTIGVHPWTRHHLAGDLVAETLSEASRDPAVRDSLGLGTDVTDARAIAPDLEQVRAALHRALDTIDAEVLASRLAGRLRAAQRPAPIGPLGQLRAASQLAGIPTLVLRGHLAAQLTTTLEGVALLASRAGRLRLEPEDLEAVRRLLASGEATVAELGVDLARRLLLGGVAVVPDPGDAQERASRDRAEDGAVEDQ